MSNEALEKALYEKMSQEQKAFEKDLLKKSPEEILALAREYVTRENILLVLGEFPGPEIQTETLLKSDTPLADIYAEIEKQGPEHGLNEIKECVETYTSAVLAEEAEKRKAMRSLPVYPYPADYARENGEQDKYRESRRANIACKQAIEDAVDRHYQGSSINVAAVKEVTDTFGFDRMLYVLANTVRQKDWDERFSGSNKRWAQTIPIIEDVDSSGFSRNDSFVVNSHSVKTDAFIDAARHEYLLTQPLAVNEIVQEAKRLIERLQAEPEPNSPNKTHFMAEISHDFMFRASSEDVTALKKFIPYKTLSLTKLKSRKGVFAVISGDENRSQKLREPRQSVLAKLKEHSPATPQKKPAKIKETEI